LGKFTVTIPAHFLRRPGLKSMSLTLSGGTASLHGQWLAGGDEHKRSISGGA